MDIGEAVKAAKQGKFIQLPRWEHKQYVWYVPARIRDGQVTKHHMMICCADGEAMPWNPLNWDLLDDGWEILDDLP